MIETFLWLINFQWLPECDVMYELIDYKYYNLPHAIIQYIQYPYSVQLFCIPGFMVLFEHNDKICEIVNPDPKLTEFLDPMTIMCAPLIHLCTVPVHQDGCCTFGHFICWSILTQPQYMARRDRWLSVQIPRHLRLGGKSLEILESGEI